VFVALLALEYSPRPPKSPPVFRPSALPVVGSALAFTKDPVGLVREGYNAVRLAQGLARPAALPWPLRPSALVATASARASGDG
jgi:hypothetical protein